MYDKIKEEASIATLYNRRKFWNADFSDRFMKRANKRFSIKKIIPTEYSSYNDLINLCYYYFELWYSVKEILYSLVKNVCKNIANVHIDKELQHRWIEKIIDELLSISLNYEWDFLWWVYQSLITEWEKNIKWSYYTPDYVVLEQVLKFYRVWYKVLDPCCWTWQYLININAINPLDLRWADIDEIAVLIARINIMKKYSWINFIPNIFNKNSILRDNIFKSISVPDNYFDLVVTNPPRGSKITEKYNWYSVTSGESFSYFIEKWIEHLKDWWVLSYILPESILNVKVHEDIRWLLLNYKILSIKELGRIFTWVFTPAIRLDIKKNNDIWEIYIQKKELNYNVNQSIFSNNTNKTFSINMSNDVYKNINKLYEKPHSLLTNDNSDWWLWIVTGNNNFFLSDTQKEWYIPVYTWKEVKAFKLTNAKKYLLYQPEKFQQIAPLKKYQSSPKLIYKFISDKLVFAIDYKWEFTLNSANIVIPKLDYSIKVIAALFNSELYQVLFKNKFNSIKVLKNHIQELPLLSLDELSIKYIEKLVDDIISWINETESASKIDKFLYSYIL